MLITEVTPSKQGRPESIRSATINGGVFELAKEEGKVIILNFWGTWCAPCIAEIPEFVQLQETYGEDQLVIVGISTPNEPADNILKFVEKLGVNYPIIYDSDMDIINRFSPPAWPTTFLIGKDGLIKAYIIGTTTQALLKPVLDKMIAES